MAGSRFTGWVLCVALVAGASPAAAQASRRVQAEALFDAALVELRAGNFAKACPALEESQRLDPGVGTLLYLGECYELSGQTASAWATFREASSIARAEGQTERADAGTARATRLENGLSRVTVTVASATAELPGLVIRRGNVELPRSSWGSPQPVDPGDHELVVTAPGYAPLTLPLRVGKHGDRVTLEVPELAPLPESSAPAATSSASSASPLVGERPPEADSGRARRGSAQRTAAVVVGVAGLAGVGVGSAFGLRSFAKNDDAVGLCPSGAPCAEPDAETFTEQARDAALVSNVAFAAGAVALTGAVVLWVTAPRSSPRAAQLTPYATADGAGLSLGGRF